MFWLALLASLPLAAEDRFTAVFGTGPHKLVVATGSPGELGLLEVLVKAFNEQHQTTVCWRKAGSGKSLELLRERQADVVMVHAPEAEKQAVRQRWAAKRTLIGSNEFYIVGPQDDPADVADAKSAADAFTAIADARAKFLSRGDNSGTHKKERAIWQQAGVTPSGDWYLITNDFMMATLRRANQEPGYFMTDSSTWVAGKKDLHNLKVLFRGDSVLVNVYHALCRPEAAGRDGSHAVGFIDFVASRQGQEIIRTYGKDLHGEAMYHDAEYARKLER